jgi:hypothetical protein
MLKKNTQGADKSMETEKVTSVEETTNSNENLPFFHQVRWEGETLSLIAKWYTGDWRNWKALSEVNPWVEPNNMFAGLKVKIPRQLLKNKKKMTREFVLSAASRNRASSQAEDVSQKKAPGSAAEGGEAQGSYMQFVVP